MKKILHVEDSEDIRHVLKVALTALGYDVTSAPDGLTARELMDRQHFDVIITDHEMPGMTGLEVVKSMAGDAHPPLVVVTSGNLRQGDECEYRRLLHNVSIIPKPFNLRDIALALSA
jgi:CheY-like chemotaxis protein